MTIRRLSFLSSALIGATLTPFVAFADPASEEAKAETIVVTAQRQAYRADIPLKLTPQSVDILEADTLEEVGITRLSDALDLSASMARQNNFGGLWDNFAVRGFAGDENLPSGYLVNGFNAGRGFGGPRDIVGIERIEILKGPSAAVFGRGEPGGAVNLVTKKPKFETEGAIGLALGSFDKVRVDGDWTGPLNDAFAVRLNGFYEQSNSFRDTLETKRSGVFPSAQWRITPKTSLTYEGEITRQELPFDRGVVSLNNKLDVVPASRFLGEPGDGPLEADATGHQLQLQHDFDDSWSLLVGAGYRATDLQGFSTEAELATARQRLFVDGQTLSRQRRFRDYEAEHTVYRAEISGRFETGALEHRLLAGFDYDQFSNDQLFLRVRPPSVAGNPSAAAGNVINIFNPIYGQFPLPTPGPQTNRLDEQEAWGFYIQDQVKLSDRLHIRLGGRYDDFSADGLNRANNTSTSFSETKFSPQAGFVFEATDVFTLYGSYGQGFRANSGTDFAGKAFAPEESESFELGSKITLLDGDLEATIAVFSMTKTNIITADPVNAGFSLAIGEAESRGLEVDVTAELPGELDLRISYAYVAAQVAKDGLDPNFAALIRKGDRLINVPQHTLSALVSKEYEVGGRELEIGGGVLFVGERLGETATAFELPAYTTLRLFATYDLTDDLELSAQVTNLADTDFYTNSFSRLWVAPGAPRNVTVALRYSF
ncbi:MAG: TonB-dependent siderophore receptor [Hyphomonadaceae bacterium]|jgi:iron complex outermembrane receptor protein|uniref:TonB-dependent siderophore receptor n=1 Tax=Aquidulcibacter sp. TaxID=2052990 RepID=UPI0022C7FF4E|nr:TonB-dependent siderophore receptor [Aquidulcibacter sp.]MCZ8207258.1 TonB-dependent siderophore receptor [Aquidulcibacter sp.]